MKGNPVVWFEIYVQDMERAKQFYESAFEVTLQKLNSPKEGIELWAFPSNMNGYGTAGALVKMDGVPSGGGGTLVYFHCEDCGVVEGRVTAAGGKIEQPQTSIGEYGHIALVFDSEGNRIGLHSM